MPKKLTETEVAQIVREKIVEVTGDDSLNITPESFLAEDLGLDSLDFAELRIGLEEEFDIEPEREEMENLRTVKDLVAFILKQLED
jgi:acyl carrier protein